MALPSEVPMIDSALSTTQALRPSRGQPKSNPEWSIADKDCDSAKLRNRPKEHGIDVVVPHRRDPTR